MKAEYIGKVKDKNGYAVHLFYRYRGYEYMITDEHNGYSETLAQKHKDEQNRIDMIIVEKEKEKDKKEIKNNGQVKTFDEELDEIWEMLEWE